MRCTPCFLFLFALLASLAPPTASNGAADVPDGDGTEGSPCTTCSLPIYDGRALYVYAGVPTNVTTYDNHWLQLTNDQKHLSNGGTAVQGQTRNVGADGYPTDGTAAPVTTFTLPESLQCQTVWYWCGQHSAMQGGLVYVMPSNGAACPEANMKIFHEAAWSADTAGELIANPMPDYSALLAQNVSGIELSTENTTLCYAGGSPAYMYMSFESREQCFARFKKPHEWNLGAIQKLSDADEQVAQEYFMQGDLDHTRGNLYYVAQWFQQEKRCTIKLARGCPFSEDVCQDSIRDRDKCLKELPNMHVTQEANDTLFNLQMPCANQYKYQSLYATRDDVHSYMSSFYTKAWNDYPASRPVNVTDKPSKVGQVPAPNYHKRGHGFCDIQRAAIHVWSTLSSPSPRGECPMAIRKFLSTAVHASGFFVGGWPFGNDLPVSWLDGWPLVWAFEQEDTGGRCHWLNLQNVTKSTVDKLLDETQCSSLSSDWRTANITVYEKDMPQHSIENRRFINYDNMTDHDILIRCPPGQYASGSSWAEFVDGAQVCKPCPLYTYKDEAGASGRCKPCPTGLGSTVTGSTSTEVCETLRDGYKWGSDEDPNAIPIDDPPSAFMNWREERSRIQQLCGNEKGCNFGDVIREARCALTKKDNQHYKKTRVLAQAEEEIRVDDPGNRRLGVFIPQNALQTDEDVSVSVAPEPTQTDDLALGDDSALKLVGARITYEPHGLLFATPVTLLMHVIPDLLPTGAVPQVYYLNTSGTDLVWELVPNSTYNAGTGEITVQTMHFSIYGPVLNTNASGTPAPPPPEPTKSQQVTTGAIIGIVVSGLFVMLVMLYFAFRSAPGVSQGNSQKKLGNNAAYYAPGMYAHPTYIV